MWARVARYEVAPERIDDAVRGFESIAEELGAIEGSRGAYLLVDRENGRSLTVTLWEDYNTMCGSEVAAARMRKDAMDGAEGTVEAVELYEVSVGFGQRASAASGTTGAR
jgi:hypothetical protein